MNLGKVSVLVLLAVLGCKNAGSTKRNVSDDDDDDRARSASSGTRGSASANAEKKVEPEAAYRFGEAYASAMFYHLFKKPEKVKQKMEIVETGATILGIAPPAPPNDDYQKTVLATSQAIAKVHGATVATLFQLGARIEDAATLAVALKDKTREEMSAKLKNYFADLDLYFSKSGLPETLWKAPYDSIKANPSGEKLFDLSKAIKDHLKK